MKFSAQDVAGLGTILSIWAHPDDESWSMGGVLAQASMNGQRVICVIATGGDAGATSDENRWPQDKLGKIRKKELEESLRILGATEHVCLDCNDGELASMDAGKCIERLDKIIKETKPDSIFTFGSDGLTSHDDHKAVHAWTMQAVRNSSPNTPVYTVAELKDHYNSSACRCADDKFNIFLNGANPKLINEQDAAILYELSDELKSKKLRALQAHASQLDRFMRDPDGYNFVLSICEKEAFIKESL